MHNYGEFLNKKSNDSINIGFDANEQEYHPLIKDHQRVSVTWACKRGRAALFFDTGLGKTLAQSTWAQQVVNHTGGAVLILAPLAVSLQTIREGMKFDINITLATSDDDIDGEGIYITNYEKLSKFDASQFAGVVLDESSILKGMNGKIRRYITDEFKETPYKLSCTATPSPNDFMELGTQSEFLGIMSQTEMLAMFFIHDGGDTSKWRLKGHGRTKFWEWLATWSIFLRSPSDLGFDGGEYELHPIKYVSHVIETEPDGSLFVEPAMSLLDRNRARKDSIELRCKKAAEIVNKLDQPCVIWCHLNDESALLASLIDGAVEVKGSDSDEHKSSSMIAFADNKIKGLVTKPKIAGFGMNWQSSHHCVFVGLSDSWEAFYQAIRRQWRFGQTKTVYVHIVSADTEGLVVSNIKRKDMQHEEISSSMMNHMRDIVRKNVIGATVEKTKYDAEIEIGTPKCLQIDEYSYVGRKYA